MRAGEEREKPWRLWERERRRKPRGRGESGDGKVHALSALIGAWRERDEVRISLREADLFSRWSEIAGAPVAEHAEPVRIEHGRLTLQVEDSAWRHQLLYMRRELIGRINGALGEKTVREIKFTA